MPVKLTKAQQRKLLELLPAERKKAAKRHARSMHMAGSGISEIIQGVAPYLGPVIKEVGPKVLKEYIMPWLRKTFGPKPKPQAGGALRLAGQGKRRM